MKSLKLRPRQPPRSRRIAGRAQLDQILDPYMLQQKPEDGTVCPQCGVIFHDGRWEWPSRTQAQHAGEELCAACRRTREKFPAGIVRLKGAFAREHKAELLGIARHQEEIEKKEHPLNRIMSIEEDADSLTINTTDIHLPRRIGETIKRTWRGKLDLDYEEEGYFVRVNWSREA
jgi:hypothetical protein